MSRPTLAAVLLVLTTISAFSQSITGSIEGNLLDPSRSAVAAAEVRLTQVQTGFTRTTRTDAAGRFFFGSVRPAEYTLDATATGFKRLERTGIFLSAAETLSVGDLTLEVGAVSESVLVTAQTPQVQTQSAERSGLLTGEQVERLAIRGRNVMSLLNVLPGVVDLAQPEQLAQNWNVYVLGSRQNTNNVSLDGATLNAIGNEFNSVVNISMDAVGEVKVLISNYQAEYGRLSGADVHLISKSGTRQFHGLVSSWKRHEQFNANNFFNNRLGLPKAPYRFNTWNYNVGGPIFIPKKFNRDRQKLFFFWSQEFWPQRIPQALQQGTVPTALERKGDFSQSFDLNNRLIVVRDPNTRQPFANNVIPASRFNASGAALLDVFPQPNQLNRALTGGNYNFVNQDVQDAPQRTDTLKLDYNLRANDLFAFNFTHRRTEMKGALDGTNWPQINEDNVNEGWLYILRHQHIFGPSLINEANISFSTRPWNATIEPDSLEANSRHKVGFTLGQFYPNINPLDLIPNAQFGGVPRAAQPNLDGRTPLTTTHKIFVLSDNVTKTLGAHTFKAGIYVDRIWAYNQTQSGPFNGSFDFGTNVNNPLDTGYAYSNALIGVFSSYSEPSARPFPKAIVGDVSFFVQDKWTLKRRFTLDYGVRFYRLPQSFIKGNQISGFWPAAYNSAQAVHLVNPTLVGNTRMGIDPGTGQIYPAVAIGAIAPGAGNPANGMISRLLDQSVPPSLMYDRGLHYAPRIGFAYDPFGNGKTSIRGGFGMFYQRMAQGMVLYNYTVYPPFVQTSNIYYGNMSTLLQSGGIAFPGNVQGLDLQGKVPTTMNFSLSVQRSIWGGTVVDAGYVGSLARHLLWARNINAIPFNTNFKPQANDATTNRPLPPAFLRTYLGYNNINVVEPGSSSNYHSLQVTATRRYARRLQYGASWTWSKAMDFNDTDNAVVSTLTPVRVWNYGLASFDRTHVLKLNWLYDLPKTSFRNPLLKGVFNNWQVSGIASFVSGAPMGVGLTTTTSVDITGSPTDGARVVVTGNPVLAKGDRTFSRYFNPSVIQLPAVGTVGNSAKTLFRGPGANNWDLVTYKQFPIHESVRIEFRWELYNAFNHTQFSNVDTTARFTPAGVQANPTFGQLSAAANPRLMQFALRFYF